MYDQLLYSHKQTANFSGICKENIHSDKLAGAESFKLPDYDPVVENVCF